MSGAQPAGSQPGGRTRNYAYADPVNCSENGLYLLPKDDPNSLAPMLESITDDQGRRIDFDLDTGGIPRWTRTNETYSGATLVGYREADYTYDVGYFDTNHRFTHDWLKQLTTTYHAFANSTWTVSTLAQNVYTLDSTGQRLTNAVTVSGQTARTESYGYDPLNRLTSVNYGDGQTQGYGFDAMGNRLTKTDSSSGNESYVYNNANMLLSRTVGNTTTNYNNDPDGNTLAGTGGRVSTWDSQNRMTGCTYNGTMSAYVYGADGIRRRSTVAGVSTDFVTDNSMMVRELRAGASIATYLMGGQGPAYRRDDAAGTIRWYVYDGLGSVVAEVDATGTVTASRKYDVYGSVRSSTGVSTSKHKFVGQLGHTSDDESGLVYMRARYMDPAVGRFVSQDPGRQKSNWFIYTTDNPTSRLDSDGRDDWTLGGMLASAGMGALMAGVCAAAASIMYQLMTVGTIDMASVGQSFYMGFLVGGLGAGAGTLLAGTEIGSWLLAIGTAGTTENVTGFLTACGLGAGAGIIGGLGAVAADQWRQIFVLMSLESDSSGQ